MAAALYVDSANSPLPTRTLNLMPFHIGYSGPAPISTYFRVKPAPPPTFGALKPEAPADPASQAENSQESQGKVTAETSVASSSTIPAIGSSSSMPELQFSSSSATLVDMVQTATQEMSQIHLRRHFVAAFRGRAMHGLQVDLPEGYSGLIFHAPDANKTTSRDPVRSEKRNGKAADLGRSNRRSRSNRAEVEEEDRVDLKEEEDLEMHDGDEDEDERILRPTGTFSSFTLWNPDIPVDEGRDEYMRSLTEWIKLSAEIHHYDE